LQQHPVPLNIEYDGKTYKGEAARCSLLATRHSPLAF